MPRTFRTLLPALVLVAGLTPAGAADVHPLVASSLDALDALVTGESCGGRDAADGDTGNGVELPFVFCDDGLVPRGGGSNGIPVPAKYASGSGGDDYTGLPQPASAEEVAEADQRDDLQPEESGALTLDVDVSLPSLPSPPGGRPLVVFMHGCCGGNKTSWEAATVDEGGERWLHSNAWFASHGYGVINYTARGFRNSTEEGSTGTTQLSSRRYEMNDYQYLAGLVVDHDAARRASGLAPVFDVNPAKIVPVGGSYGGGWAWLALTDPTWSSPAAGTPIRTGAVVTKYGWTDLLESLVPSGHFFDRDPASNKSFVAPDDPGEALSRRPLGVAKFTIVEGLFAQGSNQSGNHTTFPDYVAPAFARIAAGDPYDGDPLLEPLFASLVADRSAYYQQAFWQRVAEEGLRVPVFAAGAWTDPLFPTIETVRFVNKLKKLAPNYPIEQYFGDFQHFTANKAKEWDDLCGGDHHICKVADYRKPQGGYNFRRSKARVRVGINSRINAFLDRVLLGRGRKPGYGVSATTTICAANADETHLADEPGIEYHARDWRALAPLRARFSWDEGGVTSSIGADAHAPESDPVVRDRTAEKCYTTTQTNPGAGVVQLRSELLEGPFVMMGLPTVRLELSSVSGTYSVAARLFDLTADGTMTMVARGVCRANSSVAADHDCSVFQLSGNGWTFDRAHQVVLEISQSYAPFLRPSNVPSVLEIGKVSLELPAAPARNRRDFRDR